MGFFSYATERTVESFIASAKCNLKLFEESKFDYLLDMAITELEMAKKIHNDTKDIQPSPVSDGKIQEG